MPRPKVPTLLLAIIAGISVANTYYLQPLLHLVSVALSLHGATAGYFVTVTQVGFVLGLATLLPLGDRLERKGLIVVSLVVSAGFDIVVGVVSSSLSLGAALIGLGLFSVVAQLAVTYAAAAAEPAERSRAISKVMAGLLGGIVLARTYAGALAVVEGYRAVFLVAGVASVLLALLTWFRLPREPQKRPIAVVEIWASALRLYKTEPLLRLRSLLGLMSFACFSMFWTTMAFELSGKPYHFNSLTIGLFGFAGFGGVISARLVGVAADKGKTGWTTVVSFSLIIVSFGLFVLVKDSWIYFAILTASLDAGLQGAQLSNLSLIYHVAPGAQGRVTMVYMVNYFIGGVIGSSLASFLYGLGGWDLVGEVGALVGIVGLTIWGVFAHRESGWIARAPGRAAVEEEGV